MQDGASAIADTRQRWLMVGCPTGETARRPRSVAPTGEKQRFDALEAALDRVQAHGERRQAVQGRACRELAILALER